MNAQPNLRRWLAAGLTLAVFVALVVIYKSSNAADDNSSQAKSKANENGTLTALKKGGGWSVFGGTVYRNFVNTVDTNIPDAWEVKKGSEKNVKWFAELGSLAYGGPIVADGKVFIGTNNERPRDPEIKGDKGILMCFRESDGKFLWQSVHDKLAAGRVQDWPKEGICSSAVVEGKRFYYVSNRCELVCANTEDGKSVWKLDMIKDLHVFPHNLSTSSPMIIGDLIYVITSNGVDEGHINIPEPEAPSFIAVEKKDGKVKWAKNYPGHKIMHGQWSNAVYSDAANTPHVIFPGGDGWLYGLDLQTGDILWKFDGNPKDSKYVLGGKGTKNDFLATPVVHDNKVYIGVGQDPEHDEGIGHLWCVDIVKAIEKGKKNKDHDVSPVKDNFDPKAEVNKDSALQWHYGGKAPKDSERNYLYGRTLSTCAVHDGLVYACELAGWFHCLDAKTGKLYWEHNMESATWSSPYWVDGKIFQGNDAGQIFVFEHGKEKKEPKIIELGAKYVRATPVAANGVLYVLTETPTRLYAIHKKD